MQIGRPPFKPQRYVPRGAQAQLCWRRSADAAAAAAGGKAIIRKVTLRICLRSAPSLTAGKLGWVAHRVGECNRVPLVAGTHDSPNLCQIIKTCPSATHEIPINDAGDVMHGTYLHALNGEYILPFPGGEIESQQGNSARRCLP